MLAVDDMDEGNGCPQVAPGWHTRGPLNFAGSPAWDKGDAPAEAVDPAQMPWLPVRLAAGDVLIYGNMMPHKSDENRSGRDRRALFAIYSDADAHGELREQYYAAEKVGRRAAGSSGGGGKANAFFTGDAVVVR